MIVTCLSNLSGRNRTPDGRGFVEMVRPIAQAVGVEHVVVSPNSSPPSPPLIETKNEFCYMYTRTEL